MQGEEGRNGLICWRMQTASTNYQQRISYTFVSMWTTSQVFRYVDDDEASWHVDCSPALKRDRLTRDNNTGQLIMNTSTDSLTGRLLTHSLLDYQCDECDKIFC